MVKVKYVIKKRIGLLGGTFDPVHIGHVSLAYCAINCCNLDKVVFVPAASPPHKNVDTITDYVIRVTMLQLALASEPPLIISEVEKDMDAPTYSSEMLFRFMERAQEGDRYFFIVGADAFLEIETWNNYMQVLNFIDFIVVKRPGCSQRKLFSFLQAKGYQKKRDSWSLEANKKNVYYCDCDTVDISSSLLREYIREGRDVSRFLENSVLKYIQFHNVYR